MIARQQAGASPAGAITYIRKAAPGTPIDLTGRAWVGRTVFVHRAPPDRGPSVEFGDRDLLIPMAELPAEPERGDRVTEVIGGQLHTYELMVTAGEPAWRWSDPGHTVARVHLKLVSRTPTGSP